MRRIIILAAILFAALPLASEASARGRHHRHHVHHRHHHRYVAIPIPAPAPTPSIFLFHQSKGAAMLAEAERWIGSRNPTSFRGPWCGAFQAMVARKAGVEPPVGYLQAKRWIGAGRRLSGPAIGAIAVITRHGGGHVGIVESVEPNGNPVVVSGNHGNRVGVGVYPKSRVLAYVEP